MKTCCAVIVVLSLLSLNVIAGVKPLSTPESFQSSFAIESRVETLLGQMTLEEKIDMLGGVNDFFIRGIPRLGIPPLKMADGPLGVRNFGPATAMAGGIALAATWNPYLASRMAVQYIKGVQSQRVCATVKHFMGNNSEFDRHNSDSIIDERTMREIYLPVFEAAVKEAKVGAIMTSYNLTNGLHLTQSPHLNLDIAKNEWGFGGIMMSDWTSTYDGVAAANRGLDLEMPSALFMNRQTLLPAIKEGKVTEATINEKVRRLLRTAIQFGWLDSEQTDLSISRYNLEGRKVALQAARESQVLLKNDNGILPLNKGSIKSIAVIGPDAHPAVPVGGGSARVEPYGAVSFLQGLSTYLDSSAQVYYSRGVPTYREMAEATDFSTAASNGKPGLNAEYFSNNNLEGPPIVTRIEPRLSFRPGSRYDFPSQTLSGRLTGYYLPEQAGPYELFVSSTGEDGGFYRLYVDDKLLLDHWNTAPALVGQLTLSLDQSPHKIVLEQHGRSRWSSSTRFHVGIVRQGTFVSAEAKKLAATVDAVVLAVGFDPESEAEGSDRTFRLPPGQDELIRTIAAANKKTIVVMTSGGSVDMKSWLSQVPALIQAWYPGQEGGTAVAEVLFGEVNPSGRLPVTFEGQWADNPVHDSYYPGEGSKRVDYKEGIFVGYRGYEKSGIKPLFPFGFGLSYTTFRYSNLSVLTGITKGGSPAFWWTEVSFDVTNTGNRAGSEVAQVYVNDPHSKVPRPAKELRGFAKVELKQGETKRVTVMLNQRALSYYDVNSKQWQANPGDFNVLVGSSSAQIELRGKLTFTGVSQSPTGND